MWIRIKQAAEVAFPFLFLNRPASVSTIQPTLTGDRIPRILHQTFSGTINNEHIIRSIAELRLRNPGWDYRFYDNAAREKFINDEYGSAVLKAFRRIRPEYGAARADFFRYLLLYRKGGVYLDIKSTAMRSLDEVLLPGDVLVLSRWLNAPGQQFQGTGIHDELRDYGGSEFQQWHIMVAPGHPLMRAVIENVLRNISVYVPAMHGVGRMAVIGVTGPIAYTRAIYRGLGMFPHRITEQESLSLVYSIFGQQVDAPADLTQKHYSLQTKPLIRLSLRSHILNVVLFPVLAFVRWVKRNVTTHYSRRAPLR